MMTITFKIAIGKGEQAHTRTIIIDPDDIPLGFQEDLEALGNTPSWKDMNALLSGFLGLSRDEVRAITARQFREMMGALQEATREATTIPNG